jgi:broad specificity phosphatase PhoE
MYQTQEVYSYYPPETYDSAQAGKRVWIIRHGESKAQEIQQLSTGDELRSAKGNALLDCALSDTGHKQAHSLNQTSKSDLQAIELVVVSPLTRALQTACLCFEGITVPIVAHAGLTEFPIGGMTGCENTVRMS